MKDLRVLVVDDEPLARRRLRALLRRRPEVAAIDEAGDGEAALRALREQRPDLAFLDVQMPGLGGIDIARAVGPSELPPVVFVTAFDRYAVEAFDVAAVDYLLKPFDDDRFAEAFERALRRLAADRRVPPPPDYVTVDKSGRQLLLPCSEVDWVRAAGNYVELHARGETFLVRSTLQAAQRRLAPPRFLRIHRSLLVNVARVREIRPARAGAREVVLADGTIVPMSRRYRRALPGLGDAKGELPDAS